MSTQIRIPLYKVYWDREDIESARQVIERGTYWAIGPEIEEFEEVVAGYIGVKYAVAFNSGTSALHAVMLAYRIKEGDEVLVPSFTFIATANAPLFVGAKPVFADIEETTYGLDDASAAGKVSEKTKAIIPVHIGGLVCQDIRELKELAEKRNLLLIEDAAESLGSIAYGRKAGSFGNAAVLSFCGNKIITTGEGGIAMTDSREVYERLKLVRSHGRLEKEPYFSTSKSSDYVELGYNWRMPTIVAALGISQMKKLDRVIEKRRRIASAISSELGGLNEIEVPMEPYGFRHIYQMYTIKVKSGRKTRDELKTHLSKRGITSKVYFEPIHLTEFYRTKVASEGEYLPTTEGVSQRVLTLPLYPTMEQDEVEYLLNAVKEFFRRKK